ncbi:MAG: hypothetical protein KIT44_00340 [Opitutaceae bacterium]|nr:hypothetical protein [Opitutaceae bacterium]
MLNSTFTMKAISLLASAALVGLGGITFGFTLGLGVAAGFVITVSSLLLAAVVRDYSPRRAAWEPRRTARLVRFPTRAQVIRRRVPALTAAA